ncbi:MAG: hypothetical protein KatS3mg060_0418 [Dehalococcoidia bacterium]|nr:MAG: hypothetical protein KatS3mg060_0418 [Dehalococcoidia bacterium]
MDGGGLYRSVSESGIMQETVWLSVECSTRGESVAPLMDDDELYEELEEVLPVIDVDADPVNADWPKRTQDYLPRDIELFERTTGLNFEQWKREREELFAKAGVPYARPPLEARKLEECIHLRDE